MPIGRARKNKLQMIKLSSTLSSSPNVSVSDEEGNTSECSQRVKTSSVYSAGENIYVISSQPKAENGHHHNSKVDLMNN